MTSSSGRYHLTLAQQPSDATVPSLALGSPAASEVEAPEEDSGSPLLRVGDLAKMTGKTVRAIHHYEELGLIAPAGRSKGHYRLFDVETPVRIRWIAKLQSLGLSLGEIRALVRSRQASPSALQAARQLRTMYEEKLVEVRGRLAELTALEHELQASLAYLDACSTSCTPDLAPADCAQCERHAQADRPSVGDGLTLEGRAEGRHTDLIIGALV